MKNLTDNLFEQGTWYMRRLSLYLPSTPRVNFAILTSLHGLLKTILSYHKSKIFSPKFCEKIRDKIRSTHLNIYPGNYQ